MSSNIEDYIYDADGNMYELEVGPFFTDGDPFEPLAPKFPNGSKYLVVSKNSGKIIFEDAVLCEAVIAELKRRYGLADPWDGKPDYFLK